MRGIDGFSLALAEDYEAALDDTARDYIKRIRNGCTRMGQLIDDMLTLSRLSRGKIKKESLDLSRMVRKILDQFRENDPDHNVTFDIRCIRQVSLKAAALALPLSSELSTATAVPCVGKENPVMVRFFTSHFNLFVLFKNKK